MSLIDLKDDLENLVVAYKSDSYKWDGDLIDCSDYAKDRFCELFLHHMTSWWDDVLPPVVSNQKVFLEFLYKDSDKSPLPVILRGEIYMYLEEHLRELVQEAYDKMHNIQHEEFIGYERWH